MRDKNEETSRRQWAQRIEYLLAHAKTCPDPKETQEYLDWANEIMTQQGFTRSNIDMDAVLVAKNKILANRYHSQDRISRLEQSLLQWKQLTLSTGLILLVVAFAMLWCL
ncbi:MAG: hypothetical protein QM705_11165 [Ancrocorticia sp.]